MNDGLYFAETGAEFFKDFTSKHAMHANASFKVRYAGEFIISKKEEGGYKLVIDNNSGTYSPGGDGLGMLKKVLEVNFEGLEVEALDYQDEKLTEYMREVKEKKCV